MELLNVRDLKTYFTTPSGIVRAVDGVTFDIRGGEVFGIVGESGSGKTMAALSILKVVPYPGRIEGGQILFKGDDLVRMDEGSIRALRGSKISVVFQDPLSSLDPVFTAGEQLVETVRAHQEGKTRRQARERAMEYLEMVHIRDPRKVFHDYPHQLSGGIRQRVMIAMALINSPELLILDEPTTALDVTIQAQILDLLEEIIERGKLSILFISHDFGIIARMCHRLAVMYKGRIVESGQRDRVLSSPRDPYTISLLESVRALL